MTTSTNDEIAEYRAHIYSQYQGCKYSLPRLARAEMTTLIERIGTEFRGVPDKVLHKRLPTGELIRVCRDAWMGAVLMCDYSSKDGKRTVKWC